MRVLKKLSRSLASALFTIALGDTFDWVQSVPTGERPRHAPPVRVSSEAQPPVVNAWPQPDELKPS